MKSLIFLLGVSCFLLQTVSGECNLQFRCDPRHKQPVCGTNGVTYINDCFLSQAICQSNGQIQKASDGTCCPDQCLSKPCGPKRKCIFNFKNCRFSCPCIITCANYRCGPGRRCIHDSRRCITKCVCSNFCPKDLRPVCGTDGVTYDNQCLLNYATCQSDGKIVKEHDGNCLCKYHNPCANIICGKNRRCVPNFGECAYSCQLIVCPIRICHRPACDPKPCPIGQKCINICPGQCAYACEITRV